MTAMEWIEKQTAVWGEDAVDDLINRNYMPFLTTEGWRWIKVENADYKEYVASLGTNPRTSTI